MALSAANILKYLVTVDDKATAALKKINVEWRKFTTHVHNAERALKPLAGRLTQLAGTFVSIAAVNKAIKLAKFQIEQQVKLQVALGENIHLFDEQLRSAAEFQKATLFTDEVTLSVRAMAFSFGVANEEMDDFVRAASTLAALGLVPSIEAAARQLLFLRSGQGQPLSVISRLPGVKEIPEAEKQAGGVERMINRILGSVAEEVAKTPFGVLQQDINLINDEFERLGRALILVIGPAIHRFKSAFSGFVDKADAFLKPMAPIINAILVPIEGIVRRLITIAALLTVISIANKIITFVAGGLKVFAKPLKFLVKTLAGPIVVTLGHIALGVTNLIVLFGTWTTQAIVGMTKMVTYMMTPMVLAITTMARTWVGAFAGSMVGAVETLYLRLLYLNDAIKATALAIPAMLAGFGRSLGAGVLAGFAAIPALLAALQRQIWALTASAMIMANVLAGPFWAATASGAALVIKQFKALTLLMAGPMIAATRALQAAMLSLFLKIPRFLLPTRANLQAIVLAIGITANAVAGPLVAALFKAGAAAAALTTAAFAQLSAISAQILVLARTAMAALIAQTVALWQSVTRVTLALLAQITIINGPLVAAWGKLHKLMVAFIAVSNKGLAALMTKMKALRILSGTLVIPLIPIGAVIGVIIGLLVAAGAALVIIIAKVEPLREAFVGLMVAIGAFGQGLFRVIAIALRPMFDWVKKIFKGIGDWIDAQSQSETTFGRIVAWLREIQHGIRDGSKTFEDVADEAYLKLLPFLEFWAHLKYWALNVINAIKMGFLVMWEAIQIAGNGVWLALFGALNGLIRGAAEAIDGFLNGVAEAVGVFSDEWAEKIRSVELGQAFEDTAWGQMDDTFLAEIEEGMERINELAEERVAYQEKIQTNLEAELAGIQDLIAAEKERVPQEGAERRRVREAEAERARRETEQRLAYLRDLRVNSERQMSEQLLHIAAGRILQEGELQREIAEGTNAHLIGLAERLGVARLEATLGATEGLERIMTDLLTDTEQYQIALLEDRYEQEQISLEDLWDQRRALATAQLEREIRLAETDLEIRLKAAEKEFRDREQHESILREFGVQGQELINELRAKEVELQEQISNAEIEAIADAQTLRVAGLHEVADMLENSRATERQGLEERLAFIQDALRIELNGVRNLTNVIDQANKKQLDISRARVALQMVLLELTRKEREEAEEAFDDTEARKQAQFLRDLEVQRLRAVDEDFLADIEEARAAMEKLVDEYEKLFDEPPDSGLMETFQLIQSEKFETAAIAELSRSMEDLEDAERMYTNAVSRRRSEVELGIKSSQQARLENYRQVSSLVESTQAQIDFLRAFRDRVRAMPELAGNIEEFETDVALAIDNLINKLYEFKAAAQSMSPDFWAGISAGVRDFGIEAELTFEKARDLAFNVANTISDELTDAFISVADHSKSWKEAFSDAARNILLNIARMIIQMLIMAAIAAALGFPPGTVGALAAQPRNKGGWIGRNQGGPIPGSGPDRDSVLVAATPGEYMLRRSAAQYYAPFLNALNNRSIPRELFAGFAGSRFTPSGNLLNQGGRVASGSGLQPIVQPAIPATPQTMQTLLHGGGGTLIDFVRDHRDEIFGDDFART